METLKIKATGQVQPVDLEMDDGKVEHLEIREMKALDREKHLDSTRTRMTFSAEGKPLTVSRFEGMQADLLARCLFRKNGAAVPRTEIEKWPAAAVQALFDAAQKVSGLDKESAKAAGQESKNG